jgi:hypothetical protein
VETLKEVHLWGRLLALPTIIRLGFKSLPGSNTLPHYEHSLNTNVKSFITFGPGLSLLTIHDRHSFFSDFLGKSGITFYRTFYECHFLRKIC